MATPLPCTLMVLVAAGLLALPAPRAQAQDAAADEMVTVPAGAFTMGSPGTALDEDPAEAPVQTVDLPAFSIDRTEVTNERFARFLSERGALNDDAGHPLVRVCDYLRLEQTADGWVPRAGSEQLPVVSVTWYGARAYAEWAGKRLATEAEWEKAARGTDGRRYPWGSDPDTSRFRFDFLHLMPVGSFPQGASSYGCLDMAGSVWEWTSSLFVPYPYVANDGREDAAVEGRRVARGGAWDGEPTIAHAAYRCRFDPDYAGPFLGFRCARSEQ
jgi:formylglycine-generating enzyme required for sulfatase activity